MMRPNKFPWVTSDHSATLSTSTTNKKSLQLREIDALKHLGYVTKIWKDYMMNPSLNSLPHLSGQIIVFAPIAAMEWASVKGSDAKASPASAPYKGKSKSSASSDWSGAVESQIVAYDAKGKGKGGSSKTTAPSRVAAAPSNLLVPAFNTVVGSRSLQPVDGNCRWIFPSGYGLISVMYVGTHALMAVRAKLHQTQISTVFSVFYDLSVFNHFSGIEIHSSAVQWLALPETDINKYQLADQPTPAQKRVSQMLGHRSPCQWALQQYVIPRLPLRVG